MKLIGLKSIPDVDEANKYLKMFDKLMKLEDDFKSEEVEEGFRTMEFNTSWVGDIFVLTYEDKGIYHNMIVYEDLDDGYRSYVSGKEFTSKNSKLVTNVEYLGKEVRIKKNFEENYYKYHIKIRGKDGGVIFEAYTDESDDYYPVGVIKYFGYES